MSLKSTSLILGLALAGLLLPRSRAHAGDTGGAASACKPTIPPASDLTFNSDGVTNNSTSATRGVTCGTLRSTTSSPTNLWVDFTDGTTTGSVFCQVTVWAFFETGALWTSSQTSDRATGGNWAFHFSIPSDMIGWVELRCNLPPASSTGSLSSLHGFNLQ